MKSSSLLTLLCVAGTHAVDWIVPGAKWYDTDGNLIDAHGGQVIQRDATFYWVGHKRAGDATEYGDVIPVLYSSADLRNWKFVDEIAPAFNGIWRPKIAKPNGNFYFYGQKSRWVQIGTSPSIEGEYKNVTRQSLPPNDWGYSDTGMFHDEATDTYYILTSAESNNVQVNRITSEGLVGERVSNLADGDLEAPGMLKVNDTYYLVVSRKTGYRHNPNKVYHASSVSGPWSGGTDIAPPDTNTYNSQNTHEFAVKGSDTTTYIYMGDRWVPEGGVDSTYVWLPISVDHENRSLELQWYDRWAIDVTTGKVSQPSMKKRYEAEDAHLDGAAVVKYCNACLSKRSVHQREFIGSIAATERVNALGYLTEEMIGAVTDYPAEVRFENVLGNGASQWISLHYKATQISDRAYDAYVIVNNQPPVNISTVNTNAGFHGSVPVQLELEAGEVNTVTFGIWGEGYEVEMDGLEIFHEDFEL